MHVTELVSREVSYPAIYKCLYWLLRQMDDITKRPQNNNYWSDLQPAVGTTAGSRGGVDHSKRLLLDIILQNANC